MCRRRNTKISSQDFKKLVRRKWARWWEVVQGWVTEWTACPLHLECVLGQAQELRGNICIRLDYTFCFHKDSLGGVISVIWHWQKGQDGEVVVSPGETGQVIIRVWIHPWVQALVLSLLGKKLSLVRAPGWVLLRATNTSYTLKRLMYKIKAYFIFLKGSYPFPFPWTLK